MRAATFGHLDTVKHLIEARADVNIQDSFGTYFLFRAHLYFTGHFLRLTLRRRGWLNRVEGEVSGGGGWVNILVGG